MAAATGIPQRNLQRMSVLWGAREVPYRLLIPVFDSAYKVIGLVGVGRDLQVVWYPGAPWKMGQRRLTYKDLGTEAPPPWSEVPPNRLERAYFCDPSGAISLMLPRQPGAPSLAGAVNLAGLSLRGRRVLDVIYEPALHRVRALALRGRWGRPERVSVMQLGPLPRGLPSVSSPSEAPVGSEPMSVPPSLTAPNRTEGRGADVSGALSRLLGLGSQPLPPESER